MLKNSIAILLALFSFELQATFTLGAYVPFGTSVQSSEEGGTDTFGIEPSVAINHTLPIFWGQFFLPEAGIVFHTGEADDYSKKTFFFLLDFGMPFYSKFIFRYGVGTFLTKISGDGESVVLSNGSGTTTFLRPDETKTSWNTTLDLGVEYAINQKYSLRLEAYLFSIYSSKERELSYSLGLTYFL